ncbi:hypothetical protein CC86DRAFT_472346 [Ophiobolus disseminans]|uniref:Uncharacterized protein n=1 Tax=Ophiobolus disseminans TaxID=1469910 RepID=A0A6A6ZDW3_9PLEO|nr:hypothetical protein CC86DRAFT_472346 [Ophiobolus disseminans]
MSPRTSSSVIAQTNRSYANILGELGEDAELLKYLPFMRATWAVQFELDGAFSERLLYGDMMNEKNQLWIYFTLVGGGENMATGRSRMITFSTLKNAQNKGPILRAASVQDSALASLPFKQARNQFQVMAIAKYFFVKHGVDSILKEPISAGGFKNDLLQACRDYKAAFERQNMYKRVAEAQAGMTAGAYTSTAVNERPRTATSRRASQELPMESATVLSPAQTLSINNPRKRTRSSSSNTNDRQKLSSTAYADDQHLGPTTHVNGGQQPSPVIRTNGGHSDGGQQANPSTYTNGGHVNGGHQPLLEYFSSPITQAQVQSPPTSPDTEDHDMMIDKYITLQAKEEDLDRQIAEAEADRADVAAQMLALQARLNEASDKKAKLTDEKDEAKAEKDVLQNSIDPHKMLEIGFEAGRKWESKRQRRE